ncbi:MAG: osmoprotectant transport system substrate-binding protein [Glaciecola sp.]|jgi:osmoprotectant transport system substrate-binding protein
MFRHLRAPCRAFALLVVLSLLLVSCDSGGAQEPGAPAPLRVGAWPSVEPALLAETIAGLLRAEGIAADVREFSDATSARQALELGDVDLLPGYTGAAWLEVLERSDPPGDMRTSFARVREFDEREGLIWLRPRFESGLLDSPPANATFAFFVQGPPSRDAALRTMSQLASRLAQDPEARLCMDEDFSQREDGRNAVYRAYGISLDRQDLAAAPAEAALAVRGGECLAALATITDGTSWSLGLIPLADDLSIFPAFVIAVVIDQTTLAQSGVAAALGPFSSQLTAQLLAAANARILAAASVADVGEELAQALRSRAGR